MGTRGEILLERRAEQDAANYPQVPATASANAERLADRAFTAISGNHVLGPQCVLAAAVTLAQMSRPPLAVLRETDEPRPQTQVCAQGPRLITQDRFDLVLRNRRTEHGGVLGSRRGAHLPVGRPGRCVCPLPGEAFHLAPVQAKAGRCLGNLRRNPDRSKQLHRALRVADGARMRRAPKMRLDQHRPHLAGREEHRGRKTYQAATHH